MHRPPPARVAPLLYRVEEAAEVLRIGRTVVDELIRCGALHTVEVGTRRLVPVEGRTRVRRQPDMRCGMTDLTTRPA